MFTKIVAPGPRATSIDLYGNVNMWSNASWLMIVRRSVSPGSIVIVGFSAAVGESTCHITFSAYTGWETSLAATDPANSGPISPRGVRRAGKTQRIFDTSGLRRRGPQLRIVRGAQQRN